MLPKRRRDFDSSPDDDYERVGARDIQLLDPTPTVIVAPSPTPPGSERPSVAWIATVFSMSTVMTLTATLVLRGGEAPPATVAFAAEPVAVAELPPARAEQPAPVAEPAAAAAAPAPAAEERTAEAP